MCVGGRPYRGRAGINEYGGGSTGSPGVGVIVTAGRSWADMG